MAGTVALQVLGVKWEDLNFIDISVNVLRSVDVLFDRKP